MIYSFGALIVSATTLLTVLLQGYLISPAQTFGAFGDPFLSIQLAASPSNGDCLTTDGTNNSWATCATGGGGGGGFWSTTTNNLIIYPTSDTYTVSIGDDATSTAEFYFDPNTKTAQFGNGGTGDNLILLGSTTQWATGQASTSLSYVISPNSALTGALSFVFNRAGNLLMPYGSSTAFSATTLCLSSDCRTAWPTGGGGGSGSVSTSSPGVVSSLLYYTTAGATPELVDPVATTTLTASSPLSLSNPVAKVGGSNSILTLDTSGTWTGNAGTATALAANGANCSSGNAPLGVDTVGAVENCFDVWTEAENTSAAYLNLTSLSAISKGFFFSTTSANFYTASGLSWSTTSADAWKNTGNFWATSSANFYTATGLSWSTTSANAWQNTRNFWATTSANFYTTSGLSWSTTSANAWKNANNFFSTTSNDYYTSAGLSWSTTSANAWQNTRNFWATSSANYFTSVGLSWSTTSADAWKTINNFFSTTSSNYYTSVGLSWSTTSADAWKTNSGLLTSPDINNRVATSVVPTLGQLAYWTGVGTPSTLGSVATTSATCSGSVSCSSFTILGSSPITLTGSASGSTWPQWATTSPFTGQLVMYPNDQDNTDVVFGKSTGATSTAPFWWDVSATSTFIGNGGTGSSTVQLGRSAFEWLFGTNSTDNKFYISSSTVDSGLTINPALTIDKNLKLTFGNASSTHITVSGTASTTNLVVSGLNAASCDVKASTAGVLSCGTDATGGGASFGQAFEQLTSFLLAPTTTKGLLIGRDTQPVGFKSTLGVFGTSTSEDIIYASSTASFAGNFLRFVDAAGQTMMSVYANGGIDMYETDGSIASSYGPSALTLYNSTSNAVVDMGDNGATAGYLALGTAGVTLFDDADGALTFLGRGNGSDERLTMNLDDTADTVVWSSSTGVTVIDWSAFRLDAANLLVTGSSTLQAFTFTNGTGTNATTTALSVTHAAISTTLNLFGSVYTTLASLGNALVNAVTAVTPTGTWDFGGATSLEIVNGSNPTVDAIGEIALDTTANQLLIGTTTNASYPAVIPTEQILFSATIGSTTPEFISSGQIPISRFVSQGREVTRLECFVAGGTSKVVNLTDGTNDTETVTCGTTATADNSVDTNPTFTANELYYLEFGATTGSVNYVTVTAYGRLDRQ